MDMKNIPPEVFKWFFAQEESFAIFHDHIEGKIILMNDVSTIYELYTAYKDGALLEYLGNHGYTEKGVHEDPPY
jgi:hypothetical protein